MILKLYCLKERRDYKASPGQSSHDQGHIFSRQRTAEPWYGELCWFRNNSAAAAAIVHLNRLFAAQDSQKSLNQKAFHNRHHNPIEPGTFECKQWAQISGKWNTTCRVWAKICHQKIVDHLQFQTEQHWTT